MEASRRDRAYGSAILALGHQPVAHLLVGLARHKAQARPGFPSPLSRLQRTGARLVYFEDEEGLRLNTIFGWRGRGGTARLSERRRVSPRRRRQKMAADAERFGGLEIDVKLDFGYLLDR